MTIRSKPCRYGCGQDVVLAMMPSGHWLAFSVEPVPFAMISPDIPAIVWRPDGQHLDAHCVPSTPRQAYPMHLCRPFRERRYELEMIGAHLSPLMDELEAAGAAARAS